MEICEEASENPKENLSENASDKPSTQEIADDVLPPLEQLSEENHQLASEILTANQQETTTKPNPEIIELPGGQKVDISEISSLDCFFDFEQPPTLSEQKNPYWKAEFIKRNWHQIKDKIKAVPDPKQPEPTQLNESKPETERVGRKKPTHECKSKNISNATLGAIDAGPSLENFWQTQNLPRFKKKSRHPLTKLAARKSATPRKAPINLSELWGTTDSSEKSYERRVKKALKEKKSRERIKNRANIQEFSESEPNDSDDSSSTSSSGTSLSSANQQLISAKSDESPEEYPNQKSVLTTPNLEDSHSENDDTPSGQKFFEYRNKIINGMIETLALTAQGSVEIPDEIIIAFRKNVDHLYGKVIKQPTETCRCTHIEQKIETLNNKLEKLVTQPSGISHDKIERLIFQCENIAKNFKPLPTLEKSQPATLESSTPTTSVNTIPPLESASLMNSFLEANPPSEFKLKKWVSERISSSETKLKQLSADCRKDLKTSVGRLCEESLFKTTRFPLCYMQKDSICSKNFITSAYRCLHEDFLIFLSDYERVNLDQPNLT